MNITKSNLDEFHPSPAYHAGRLLAVCQHIQDLVAPDVGRTYVDSFFSAACANPKIVLPRVWTTARSRLRQITLFKDRRDIEDLATRIYNQFGTDWPARQPADVQALFQLGYFHQRANLPITDSRRRILCNGGYAVKSQGEKLVADILFRFGIDPGYEIPLTVPDPKKESKQTELKPDFTIRSEDGTRNFYIEFCGMLGDPGYDRSWAYKRARYVNLNARTWEDVETDGQLTEDTYIQLKSEDVRDVMFLESKLIKAIHKVTGLECHQPELDTPF